MQLMNFTTVPLLCLYQWFQDITSWKRPLWSFPIFLILMTVCWKYDTMPERRRAERGASDGENVPHGF